MPGNRLPVKQSQLPPVSAAAGVGTLRGPFCAAEDPTQHGARGRGGRGRALLAGGPAPAARALPPVRGRRSRLATPRPAPSAPSPPRPVPSSPCPTAFLPQSPFPAAPRAQLTVPHRAPSPAPLVPLSPFPSAPSPPRPVPSALSSSRHSGTRAQQSAAGLRLSDAGAQAAALGPGRRPPVRGLRPPRQGPGRGTKPSATLRSAGRLESGGGLPGTS